MHRLLVTLIPCLFSLAVDASDGKTVAITVDDLPVASTTPVQLAEMQAITTQLLAALNKHGANAVGFVNEDRLLDENGIDANVALLEAWLNQGMELGNHTFGHPVIVRLYRRAFHYRTHRLPVFVHLRSSRQIPQVWLIHANRINAEVLEASLELFKQHGYTFISLEEALEDPAYATQAGPSQRFGPSWLLRWARARNARTSVYGQPEPSDRVMSAYRASCE